jgi:arylsulfatase A-like enzyme
VPSQEACNDLGAPVPGRETHVPTPNDQRPNILFVILHDLGTHLGCYGNPSLRTTNIDQLAAEGVRLENYFCTTPLCSPSRASILTGRHPHQNGMNGLVHRGFSLKPSEQCLPKLLGEAGYRTLLFGFQHEARDPSRLGYQWVSDRQLPNGCATVTPMVLEFLRQEGRSSRRQPFFAMVGFQEVHRPFKGDRYTPDDPAAVHVPPYLPDTPEVREDLADFHGLIHAVDACVGAMTEELSASGLAENTWVIFTTDHGIAFPRAKSTLYDPGVRTACLMRWPAGLEGGRTFSQLLSNIDLLPTILRAIGASAPETVAGRSFFPLLADEEYQQRDCVFLEKSYHDIYDPIRAIRTERHKYIRNYEERPWLPLPSDIARSPSARTLRPEANDRRPAEELYDLKSDPLEATNLIGEPQLQDTLTDLRARMERWQRDTDDPILKGPIPLPAGARIDPAP